MSLLRITAGIISQPASGSLHRPPWPTGPSLQAGYSVPLISATTVRSASLARTPWLHLIGLYRRPCPTTWSGLRTTPSRLWVSVPCTRAVTSTPGGESGPYPRPATLLHGLPHQNSESAPPMFPTSASVGALLSTLLPVFALLRPARLLALLDRSDLERHRSPAAEDFLPELSRGRSPSPRVGYRYTAPGGGHRDRTFTGWSTAVTGCAFWRRTGCVRRPSRKASAIPRPVLRLTILT